MIPKFVLVKILLWWHSFKAEEWPALLKVGLWEDSSTGIGGSEAGAGRQQRAVSTDQPETTWIQTRVAT